MTEKEIKELAEEELQELEKFRKKLDADSKRAEIYTIIVLTPILLVLFGIFFLPIKKGTVEHVYRSQLRIEASSTGHKTFFIKQVDMDNINITEKEYHSLKDGDSVDYYRIPGRFHSELGSSSVARIHLLQTGGIWLVFYLVIITAISNPVSKE